MCFFCILFLCFCVHQAPLPPAPIPLTSAPVITIGGGAAQTALLDESLDSQALDDSDEFGDESMTLFSPVTGQKVLATVAMNVAAAAPTTADAAPVKRGVM